MISRDDIVAAARRRIGTPWVHQGRLDGLGLDCIGFVSAIAAECQLLGPDTDEILGRTWTDYGRWPDGRLLALLRQYLIPVDSPSMGDVIAFRLRSLPQHVGILTDRRSGRGLIHALSPDPGHPGSGGVREVTFARPWTDRAVGAFTWPVLAGEA